MERRIVGYGIAGSLAVHLLVIIGLAMSMSLPGPEVAKVEAKPEPEETLLFPANIEVVQAPPQVLAPKPIAETQHYIRTTQNEDAGVAPMKADFISDRNTVATSKLAPDAKADSPMPTTNGVNVPTFELANRNAKAGELKNDSAPTPPPAKPSPAPSPVLPPKPEMRPPEPDLQVVKKDETPSEKLMHEAEKDGSEHLPLDVRKPMNKADEPPKQREPMDEPPVPKAIPIATPLAPPTPPPVPALPKPEKNAFSPETRTSKAKGTISNRGEEDAVNAVGSPSGRYMRKVTGAIEQQWSILRIEKGDFVQPGKLRLHFYVNKQGKPEHLEVLSGDAKTLLREFSMRAVMLANIPPIPPDLLPILDQGRFEIEYDIVVY